MSRLSFEIDKKDKIRIIGPNGLGKTTILRLLLDLYWPQLGNIYLKGIDSKQIDKYSFRTRMSIVSQKINLFSGTIKDNLKYGLKIEMDDFDNLLIGDDTYP